MIKHFCDVCDNEIADGNHATVDGEATLRTMRRGPRHLHVAVAIRAVGDDPEPELCGPCAFAAINKLNPEPMEADRP